MLCAMDDAVGKILQKVRDLGLTASDVVAQNASQCFDISVWQCMG